MAPLIWEDKEYWGISLSMWHEAESNSILGRHNASVMQDFNENMAARHLLETFFQLLVFFTSLLLVYFPKKDMVMWCHHQLLPQMAEKDQITETDLYIKNK